MNTAGPVREARRRLTAGLVATGCAAALTLAAPVASAEVPVGFRAAPSLSAAPAGAPAAGAGPDAAFATGATPTATPTADSTRQPVYRAIGDSYAAGYALSGPAGCARSVHAYPVLLARTTLRRYRLQFRACSGATTQQVARHQLGPRAANGAVRIVTVSAGGNDVGFGAIATCAPDVLACEVAIGHALALERSGVIRRNVATLLRAVHAAMPNATVYVLDYPIDIQHTRSQAGCDDQTQLAIRLFGARLDQIDVGLDAAVHGAVAQITAADAHRPRTSRIRLHEVRSMIAAFTGHAMCSPANWIGRPGSTSPLHPNAIGQAQLAKAVRRAL